MSLQWKWRMLMLEIALYTLEAVLMLVRAKFGPLPEDLSPEDPITFKAFTCRAGEIREEAEREE